MVPKTGLTLQTYDDLRLRLYIWYNFLNGFFKMQIEFVEVFERNHSLVRESCCLGSYVELRTAQLVIIDAEKHCTLLIRSSSDSSPQVRKSMEGINRLEEYEGSRAIVLIRS